MPTINDETLLERYQREHRDYEEMNMSKAERLAVQLLLMEQSGLWYRSQDAAAELRRLSAINAELLEALSFYAEESRYRGPNQAIRAPDTWSEKVGMTAYRLDVTRDQGGIARAAIAKAQGGE